MIDTSPHLEGHRRRHREEIPSHDKLLPFPNGKEGFGDGRTPAEGTATRPPKPAPFPEYEPAPLAFRRDNDEFVTPPRERSRQVLHVADHVLLRGADSLGDLPDRRRITFEKVLDHLPDSLPPLPRDRLPLHP